MEQSATCSNKPRNQLLAALPNDIYQRICVFIEPVELPQHQVLYHPGDRYQYAYFPTDAIVSNVAILENGSTAEIGVVGNEGMVGVPIILNTDYIINSSLVVQVGGSGLRIPARELLKEFDRNEVFQRLLLHYLQARIIQISQTATCNSYHTIEQRLARWLLTVRDSIQRDEFYLTQEFISQMLGVRRAGVTQVASQFQKAGIIQYRRGWVRIVSVEKLRAYSCECYDLVKHEFERIVRVD